MNLFTKFARPSRRRLVVSALAAALVAATLAVTTSASSSAAQPTSNVAALRAQLRAGALGLTHGMVRICQRHKVRCQADVLTVRRGSVDPFTSAAPVGYGAKELEKAYGVQNAPDRAGTIVVIGAGAYPTLESDLAIYRSAYRLPACTTANGCFKQINYKGGKPYAPTTNRNWQFGEEEIGVETALDVDMASAACPNCKIVSIQAPLRDGFFGSLKQTHAAILHFATAVQTAAKLGASAVSISYGYPIDKYSTTGTVAKLMTQRGLPIVSSSGDFGFMGSIGQWPQGLPTVISAGGTSLYKQTNKRGYVEVAWNGAGSGCTPGVKPATGQPQAISRLCRRGRAATDISAVSDPFTGVAVYDSYAPASGQPLGYFVVGGTSAASPFIAGLFARAPRNPAVLGPNSLYGRPASAFHDVTTGTNFGLGQCRLQGFANRLCDAGTGWDGPTGLGTPRGLAPFRHNAVG